MPSITIELGPSRVGGESSKVEFTYADIAQLPEWPEGPLVEIISGDLFLNPSPTPNHQRIIRNVLRYLDRFVHNRNMGEVLSSPIDVYFTEKNYVIPDLVFVSTSNLGIIQDKHIRGSPDLIVEVVSTDRAKDYISKKKLYEEAGVREYWIIDNAGSEIVVYTLGGNEFTLKNIYGPNTTLKSSLPELTDFSVNTDDIFS